MNIDFCKSHMETLADLMKIAEKHNCTITFGVTTHGDREIDDDVLKKNGFTAELLNEMYEKMEIKDAASTFDKAWFQLYEKDTETYHTMAFIENSTYAVIEKESENSFLFRDDDEAPSDELIANLEEIDELYEIGVYTINQSYNPTIIHGFGNKEKVEDFRVYRPGMALKFFGDLVCDYLKEPRIQRYY